MRLNATLVCSLFLASLIPIRSEAAAPPAIGNEDLSARQVGEWSAGISGQSEDPAMAYINPAGLTHLPGTQATVGLTLNKVGATYVSQSAHRPSDNGNEYSMTSHNAVVPNMAVTHAFMDGKLGAGLSVESPYGLETHWDPNSPLRYISTNSKLHMAVVSPAVGYQINPMVAVGVGVDYYNAFDVALERNLQNLGGAPDGDARFSGSAANWGFHLGTVLDLNEYNSLGIVYRSKVKLNINGNLYVSGLTPGLANIFGGSTYQTSAYTDLYLPQTVQFGYAFKPNKKWSFETDLAWFDMSVDRDQNVRFATPPPTPQGQAALAAGNPAPLDWRNMWSFATGFNYKQNERWQWRSSFFYLPYTVPEATFNPSIADMSRWGLGFGGGYALTQSLTLDFAYAPIFYITRTINNTVGQTVTGNPQADISGTYKGMVHVVSANLTYRI